MTYSPDRRRSPAHVIRVERSGRRTFRDVAGAWLTACAILIVLSAEQILLPSMERPRGVGIRSEVPERQSLEPWSRLSIRIAIAEQEAIDAIPQARRILS